jgi:hypothetical protein
MSCCGRQVTNFTAPAVSHRLPLSGASAPPTHMRHSQVYFEYSGQTGLTVTGPVSGRRYRFDGPGARLAVEPVDKPSLERVPNLRRVMRPY